MNWRLSFAKSGTLVNILNHKNEILYSRRFLGWRERDIDDSVLIPKFEIFKDEKVIVREDNIYIEKSKKV